MSFAGYVLESFSSVLRGGGIRAWSLRTTMLFAFVTTSLSAQIPLPGFVRSYEAPAHARGFCFEAPVAITVTGVQVPDESGLGEQSVALYRLSKKPPKYFESLQATPVWVETGRKSSLILEPPVPIPFAKGQWLAVLGTCGDASRQVSSYGANLHATTVLGRPVTLERLLMQDNLVRSKGVGELSTNDQNPLGRVRVFLAGGARAEAYGEGSGFLPLPVLAPEDTAPPRLGHLTRFHVEALFPREPVGLVMLGMGRDHIVTPLGTILLGAPFLGTAVLPRPIPSKGLTVDLGLPGSPALAGLRLNLQVFVFRDPDYALTNGLEWRLGP